MKHNNKCPKCGSTNISFVPSSPRILNDPRLYGTSSSTSVPISRYICTDCGYMEEWLDPDAFKKSGIMEYWQKKAEKERELNEMDSYWREKLKESKSTQK